MSYDPMRAYFKEDRPAYREVAFAILAAIAFSLIMAAAVVSSGA